MAVVGPHCGCVALREARHRARHRGAQARQLDLSGGPRHPDAAGGVEQRALLAETGRGSPDEMRRISRVERRAGAEREILSRRHPFAAAVQLRRSAGDSCSAQPTDDPIEQMLHQAHELAQRIRRLRFKAGSLDLDFPETKIRLDERGNNFAHREDRERRVAPVDRGVHVAGERSGGGAVDEPAHAGGLSRPRSSRTSGACRSIGRRC